MGNLLEFLKHTKNNTDFFCKKSKVIVDVNEEIFDCENSLPNSAVDFSSLEYELDDKDELTLNGKIRVNEDYESPIGLNFYTRHLEHGKWNVGLFSTMVKDFCPDLLNPMKPWYFITKTLNQTQCPYKKGVRNSVVSSSTIMKFELLKFSTLRFWTTCSTVPMEPLFHLTCLVNGSFSLK